MFLSQESNKKQLFAWFAEQGATMVRKMLETGYIAVRDRPFANEWLAKQDGQPLVQRLAIVGLVVTVIGIAIAIVAWRFPVFS